MSLRCAFPTAVVLCMGCRPAPTTADAPAPTQPAPANVEGRAATPDDTSEAALTGLAECDFFLTRYDGCIRTLDPVDAEAARNGLAILTDHFVEKASLDPDAARVECGHAVVEQRKHAPRPGCDWTGGPPVEALAAQWVAPTPDTSGPGLHIVETSAEGLDGPIAGRLIRARFNLLRPCLDPGVEASMTLTLTIDAKGNATESKVASSELCAESVQCIEDASRGWRFPRPSTGSATVASTLKMTARP